MTANQGNDDYKPNDYTLERWIAALLALLMFLPWIAYGEETAIQDLPTTTLSQMEDAALLFKTGTPGVYAVAPALRTDVQIGARLVVGEIKEKQDATRVYQQAKSEGRRAALVEQHRPNVFTTSVASVMPGEEATIEIEYQETARFDDVETQAAL